jgi:hypothetical protein
MKCHSSVCNDPSDPRQGVYVQWGDRIWHTRCFSADGIPIHQRYWPNGHVQDKTVQPDLFSVKVEDDGFFRKVVG